MFELNHNGIWQLMTTFTIGLKPEEEKALAGELKSILAMDLKQLEENIRTGKQISLIEGIENNIEIIILWCKENEVNDIRTLSYIIKLVCYEILKNQDYSSVCTTNWLIKQNSELSAFFKIISGEPSWLMNLLDKAAEPSFILTYYTAAAAVLLLLSASLDNPSSNNLTNNPITDNTIFALKCLCFLPVIGGCNAFKALRGSYQWASSFFAGPSPKIDRPQYIQPPTPLHSIHRP